MLLFMDQQRMIKVVRAASDASGKMSRTRVGTINKVTLAKNLGKKIKLSQEESQEIDNTLDVLRRARVVKRQAYALEFPEIIREVLEYCENGASRTERELITTAVLEATRRVRKMGKAAA